MEGNHPGKEIDGGGFLIAMIQALSTFGWDTLSSVRCENKYAFYKKLSFYLYLILIFYVRSFQFSTKIIKTDFLSVRIKKSDLMLLMNG